MALKIRLSRGGAKKRPFYRIVVADSRKARDGRFIERLGHFDPMLAKDHPERVLLKEERIKHWLGHGATASPRVQGFLANVGLAEKPKVPEQTKKHLPRAKTLERLKAAEEASKAAEEASKAAEEASKAAEEASKAAAEAAAAAPAEAVAEEAPAEEAPAEDAAAKDGAEEKAE